MIVSPRSIVFMIGIIAITVLIMVDLILTEIVIILVVLE